MPTWNYMVVHVVGTVEIVKEPEHLQEIVEKPIHFNEHYEPNPWQANFVVKAINVMLNGVVGVEVSIDTIEGKWKMNQHHPVQRQQNAIEELMQSPQIYAKQVVKLMNEKCREAFGIESADSVM